MNLTVEQIEKDIAGFEARIETVRQQLAAMPEGYLPHPEHKRRKKQRREYESECSHCLKLIEYAREGIAIRQTETE